MKLNSAHLEAFYAVARSRNFTVAADQIHVTQSALSQRILNLESALKATLFIRDPAGVQLTEAGSVLLRYCQKTFALEEEVLTELQQNLFGEISGELRIAGFSSVMWSVVVPALRDLVADHPHVRTDFRVGEMAGLPRLLKSAQVDFIVTSETMDSDEIETHLLGYEENVLVRPKRKALRHEIYLDHDPNDKTTGTYFKLQGQKQPKFARSYMDDVYGLISAVRCGWGSAILPRHLIGRDGDLTEVKNSRVLKLPVYLIYYKQPYYSRLHEQTIDRLRTNVAKGLSQSDEAK